MNRAAALTFATVPSPCPPRASLGQLHGWQEWPLRRSFRDPARHNRHSSSCCRLDYGRDELDKAGQEVKPWLLGRSEQTAVQSICRCPQKAQGDQQPMSHQQNWRDILWLKLLLCKREHQSSDSQAQVHPILRKYVRMSALTPFNTTEAQRGQGASLRTPSSFTVENLSPEAQKAACFSLPVPGA